MSLVLPPLSAFAAWLQALSGDVLMGERASCTGCPLALWLQSLYLQPVVVDEQTVLIGDAEALDYRLMATPDAYRQFLDAIDYGGTWQRSVTVDECRTVLQKLQGNAMTQEGTHAANQAPNPGEDGAPAEAHSPALPNVRRGRLCTGMAHGRGAACGEMDGVTGTGESGAG